MACGFCTNGFQTRFESGRGQVAVPCAICHPEQHAEWAKAWTPAEKPKPKPDKQCSMFAEPPAAYGTD